MKKRLIYLGLVIVLALSITACGKGSDIKENSTQDKKQQEETKQEEGTQEDEIPMLISEDTAKTIALNYTEVNEADAEELKVELIKENEADIYSVGFHVADKEYGIKINASTGEVVNNEGQEEEAPQEEGQPELPEGEETGEGQAE